MFGGTSASFTDSVDTAWAGMESVMNKESIGGGEGGGGERERSGVGEGEGEEEGEGEGERERERG